MITILNIKEAEKEKYDDVWAIVRYYKGKSSWIKHVSELSPSQLLCAKFYKLKNNREWNKSTFDSVYLPAFLKEMCGKQAKEKLNELYIADKEGKHIALLCFCQDETLCHRSIIAGLLQGVGCDVHTTLGNDYSKYYQEYQRIRGEQ